MYRNFRESGSGIWRFGSLSDEGRLLHETELGAFVHNQKRSDWLKSRRRSEKETEDYQKLRCGQFGYGSLVT